MKDDMVFDEWLHQRNEEFIESISDSLDVDRALAAVKHRVMLAKHERISRVVSSLNSARTDRARRTSSAVRAVLGRSLTSKMLVTAGIVAAVGLLFFLITPLPDIDMPIPRIPALADSPTGNVNRDSGPGGSGGGHQGGGPGLATQQPEDTGPAGSGQASRGPDPTPGLPSSRQPAPGLRSPGQPAPPAPGQAEPPGPPAAGPSAPPAAGQPAPTRPAPPAPPAPDRPAPSEPAEPPVADASVEPAEQRVELSTQAGHESVTIDGWQPVGDGSGDLRMEQGGIRTVQGAKLSVVNDSAELSYDRCAQAQNWTTRVDFAALRKGSRLCALSSRGNYAALRVDTLPEPSGSNGRFIFYGRNW